VAASEAKRDGGAVGPFRAASDGVRLALRLQPRASRNRIEGVAARGDGALVLSARVTAPPEDGKANAAAVALLAKAWGLPKRDIQIVSGATDRNKVLHIAGDPAVLLPRLRAWLASLGGS